MALTSEDLQAIAKLMNTELKPVKDEIKALNSRMDGTEQELKALNSRMDGTEQELKTLNSKIDSTKQELLSSMEDMEHSILNSCLGYTDEQDESIIKKIDNIQYTVDTATRLKTIDNDLYILVNKRIDEVVERVEQLKKRIS